MARRNRANPRGACFGANGLRLQIAMRARKSPGRWTGHSFDAKCDLGESGNALKRRAKETI
jgi:hypothetical protein